MNMHKFSTSKHQGQTAIEYLLLLALVAIVVLSGMKYLLPRSQRATELFYNRAANSIMSNATPTNLRTFYLPQHSPEYALRFPLIPNENTSLNILGKLLQIGPDLADLTDMRNLMDRAADNPDGNGEESDF